MATIVKSIGATGRDYTTVDAWEADLDESSIYSAGDTAQGEMYADSTFEISSTIDIFNGGTIGLYHRTLTAAAGERHDGTANTGVRILCTNTGSNVTMINCNNAVGDADSGGTDQRGNQISYIEFDANEKKIRQAVQLSNYNGIQQCLIHGVRFTNSYNITSAVNMVGKQTWVCNNILYDVFCDSGTGRNQWGVYGIYADNNDWMVVTNNTIYGVKTDADQGGFARGGYASGIYMKNGGSLQRVYNNIVMDTLSENTTDELDFRTLTSTTYTDRNYSSDTSAPGATNYRSESAADTFVSTSAGSEDFHLKSGANAIGTGKDCGTRETVGGRPMPYPLYTWPVDIDGRDRDTEGDTWDIGADQYVAAASAQSAPIMIAANTAL
tara:strand:- start:127 stop:1272 length:1146 start_codon:yes stop_codon:yes gene_type:complete